MKIALELDDASPKNSNLGLLEDLKDHYKNFKVNLFTVAWEIRWADPTPITEEKYGPFCEALKKSTDWMEIEIHGLTHVPAEFKTIDSHEAEQRILIAEKMFINRGINYAKIFKAPYWQLSKAGKDKAIEMGFKVVEDHYYNWNLKDEMPKDKELIIAHGHIQNVMGNGLEEVMPKLLQLPPDTEFLFLSEVLGAEKVIAKEVLAKLPKIGGEVENDRSNN